MMNPASSSSDDDSSSSGVSIGRERTRAEYGNAESDDGSSDDDGGEHNFTMPDVSNFDDLPTDDSEDDSDDDGSDSSDDEQRGAGDKDGEDDEGVDQEDVPLSERVASRARAGRRYYTGDVAADQDYGAEFDGGKRRRAERKSRAIELASERLREARKEKGAAKQKAKRYEGSSDDSSVEQAESNNKNDATGEKKRKKSKHKPTEMSSKRKDYFARGRPDLNSSGIGVSIGANKYKARDPRMVSLSGHLDADVFEKRYGFLDAVQDKEIERLQRRVKAWQKSGKKGQRERKKLGLTQGGGSLDDDKEELTRLLQERAERKKAHVLRAAKRSVKQKLRKDVAEGKRGAYYPKRSELKRMEAEAKFNAIRKQGGDEAVEKAIAKRRKKNLSKAAKQMPSHMVS